MAKRFQMTQKNISRRNLKTTKLLICRFLFHFPTDTATQSSAHTNGIIFIPITLHNWLFSVRCEPLERCKETETDERIITVSFCSSKQF